MAKNKDADLPESGEAHLTIELKKSIDDLIYQKKQIAADTEALNEAVAAVAEKLGVKPAVLKRRVDLIIKEEEKGGEVKSKENDINFVEQYFTVKDNAERNGQH
jgi:hypothetical protein